MYTPVPTAVIEALRERIRCLEGGAKDRRAVLPFGIKAIDERLPEGGLALGALHEVAGGGNGAIDGAAAALFAAGIVARTRGRVLWCVTRQDLFAPALASAGLAPDRVIYVEAGDEKSVLACFEEGLRHGGSHGGLGAVVAEVARLSMTASRRLQLAAESSGAIGIAIRRLPRLRGKVTSVSSLTLGSLDSVIAHERAWEIMQRSSLLSPHPEEAARSARGRLEGWPRARPSKPPSFETSAPKSVVADFGTLDCRSRASPTSVRAPQDEGRIFHTLESRRSNNPLPLVGNASLRVTGRLAFTRSRPWPTSATIERAKSETSDFAGHDTKNRWAEREPAADFGQPTAAVTRWRVNALPSAPLPVPGIGRARWRLELIRCRGGESAEFTVEACDAQGRLALPSDLVDGSGPKAIGQRRTAG
jgi:hypothetical protein